MSKRKGDFRSKIDSILADDPATETPGGGATTGLDRMFGGEQRSTGALDRMLAPTTETKLDEIDVASIKLARGRRTDADKDLVESVGRSGILQPLLLRSAGNGFEVLDGGRRLTIARQAGLKTVPAVVRTISDAEARAMAAERKAVPATSKPAPTPAIAAAVAKPSPKPAARARSTRPAAAPAAAAPAAAAPAAAAAAVGASRAAAAGTRTATAPLAAAAAAVPAMGAASASKRPATRRATPAPASRPSAGRKAAAGAAVRPASAAATAATATTKGATARRASAVAKPASAVAKPASAVAKPASAVVKPESVKAKPATAVAGPLAAAASTATAAAKTTARPRSRTEKAAGTPVVPEAVAPVAEADETLVMPGPKVERDATPEPVSPQKLEPVPPPRARVPAAAPAGGMPAAAAFPRRETALGGNLAAASESGAAVATPSRGRDILATAFMMVALFSLTWAVVSLFYGHTDLAMQAGVGVVVGLALFGATYLAGRRS